MSSNPTSVIDLPYPPSVNRTRKVHWRGEQEHREWVQRAHRIVMAQPKARRPKIDGPFEAKITVDERSGLADLDNGVKAVIDYATRIELIRDDNPRFFRRLVVEFGDAPEGCRLELTPL